MTLLAVGVGYRSAPADVLAALTTGTAQKQQVLAELLGSPEVSEALVISTCNRVEVYACVRSFHGALGDIATVLSRRSGVELTALAPALYAHYADEAVRQLFTVAAGLDSLVRGERQILGQVRAAYTDATAFGAAGTTIHEAMQRALRAGKRVHAEATTAGSRPCMADSALRLGMIEHGTLHGAKALVVGAGQMGSLAAAALRRHGVGELRVLSRSLRHARELAATVDARAGTLDQLSAALTDADVAVFATGSPQPVLDRRVAAARLARSEPLLLVDLAMPADVAPDLLTLTRQPHLPAITVINLATLAAAPQLPGAAATEHVAAARRIVSEELAGFTADRRAAGVTPMIVALRERANDLVSREMAALDLRSPNLGDAERADVLRAMRRLANSLLHDPTVRVKELAATSGGSYYAAALAELFDLDMTAQVAHHTVSTPQSVAACDVMEAQ